MSSRPLRTAFAASLALGVLVVSRGQARADLLEDRDRVVSAFGRAGGEVVFSGTRFLFDDESVQVAVPPSNAPCVRVAVIGSRGTTLRARFADAGPEDREGRATSHAGALQLTRCGAPAGRLVVVNESGSGAVEILAMGYRGAMPALGVVLPERGQVEVRAPELPMPMNLAAPERRAQAARESALREGATDVGEVRGRAPAGTGQAEVTLAPGCHRVTVVATALGAADPTRIDVDAEMRDENGVILARDKSDAPDARLEPCTTTRKAVTVSFVGAPEGSVVVVATARFEVASALPAAFGDDARLRMDRALRKRAAKIDGAPVLLAQGGAGLARVPFETDRVGCYLAVAGIADGTPHGLGLRARLAGFDAEDERGSADDAGVVAFCAHGERRAMLEVEARGTGVHWGLAVFRTSDHAGARR